MKITRKDLIQQGASQYLAIKLTKGLKRSGRKDRAYLYKVTDIIGAIDSYLLQKRIRPLTRNFLNILKDYLLSLVSSKDGNSELEKLSQEIIELGQELKTLFNEAHKRDIKYRKKHPWKMGEIENKLNNNIVSFTKV